MKYRKPREVYIKKRQIGRSKTTYDKRRTAMRPGKRRSRTGRIYYEYRKNRSDINKRLRV